MWNKEAKAANLDEAIQSLENAYPWPWMFREQPFWEDDKLPSPPDGMPVLKLKSAIYVNAVSIPIIT